MERAGRRRPGYELWAPMSLSIVCFRAVDIYRGATHAAGPERPKRVVEPEKKSA
jgi:hypothetical protein